MLENQYFSVVDRAYFDIQCRALCARAKILFFTHSFEDSRVYSIKNIDSLMENWDVLYM